MTIGVPTRLISLSDLSDEQVDAWRRLAARAAEPNPFFEPEFVLPAAARSTDGRGALLVLERDGEWLACLPVRPRGTPPLGALQAWRHRYCFLATPLVDRDCVELAAAELVAAVREHNRFLALPLMALDGPVGAALERAVGAGRYELVFDRRFERSCLVREPGAETPDMASKDRRRRLRRLEERLGGAVVLEDRSGDPQAVDEFLRLEAASWKGEAGTALASSEADAAFFREMWADFTAAGRTRLLALSGGSSPPIAMLCELAAGDALFAFKMAFDESYRSLSPGVELLMRVIEDFSEHRPERLMDSCAAHDSKLMNRLMPDRRSFASLVIGPSGPRAVIARGAARAVGNVHARRRERAVA